MTVCLVILAGTGGTAWGIEYGPAADDGAGGASTTNTAIGGYSDATGTNSTALGGDSTATGSGSTALGNGAYAGGTNSVAVGYGSSTGSDYSTAINGAAAGTNSTAVGGIAGADNATALGGIANATGSTALGENSAAMNTNSVAIGTGSTTYADDTVSVGRYNYQRRITNVADGVELTDVATYGQLLAATTGFSMDFSTYYNHMSSRVDKVEERVSDLGALSSAMSALVPNSRAAGNTQIAVGAGYYRDSTAMAVGAFHYINDNILVNAGVSTAFNHSETAGRAGVTIGW